MLVAKSHNLIDNLIYFYANLLSVNDVMTNATADQIEIIKQSKQDWEALKLLNSGLIDVNEISLSTKFFNDLEIKLLNSKKELKFSQNLAQSLLKKPVIFNSKQFVIDYMKSTNVVLVNSQFNFENKDCLYYGNKLDNELYQNSNKEIQKYDGEDKQSIFHQGGRFRYFTHALINAYLFNDSTYDVINDCFITKENIKTIFKHNKFILLIISKFENEKPLSEKDFYVIFKNFKINLDFIRQLLYKYDMTYLFESTGFFDIVKSIDMILLSDKGTNEKIYEIFNYLKIDIKKEKANHKKFSQVKSLVINSLLEHKIILFGN